MGDEYERNAAVHPVLLLDHLGDRDVVARENRRNFCKHACFVMGHEAKIVGALEIIDKFGRRICILSIFERGIPEIGVSCAVNHVADDGARRWHSACAAAVKHNIFHAVARDINSIIAIFYAGERVGIFNISGMNAHLNPFISIFAYSKEFECITELLSILNIRRRNASYTLTINLLEGNLGVECEAGENR